MKNSPQPTRASVYLYGMVVYSTIHRLAGNYPEADGYAEIEETHRVPGGETGNSAIVLARWGHRVKVAGPCLGRETRAGVQEFFAGRGIDCSGLPVDESFDGVRDLVLVGGATRTVFGRFGQYSAAPNAGRSRRARTSRRRTSWGSTRTLAQSRRRSRGCAASWAVPM